MALVVTLAACSGGTDEAEADARHEGAVGLEAATSTTDAGSTTSSTPSATTSTTAVTTTATSDTVTVVTMELPLQATNDDVDEVQFPLWWRDDESGSGGTLVFAGGAIALDSAECFLEEQDAAGGGKILFAAQALAIAAGGDGIVLEASRYDEDSQFTGDHVKIDIIPGAGDPEEPQGTPESFSSIGDIGTVTADDSSVASAGDLTFISDAYDGEFIGSFEINC